MRPSAKHITAAVSPKPSLGGHLVPCSWVRSRAPTATRGRSCCPRTWGDECVWFPRTRRCRTAATRHMGRVEMDPGESPCCGTGSTGKPSGVAQVGEQAEAVPDGLAAGFLSCLCARAHTHTPTPCPGLLGRPVVALPAGGTGINWKLSLCSKQEQREEELPVFFWPQGIPCSEADQR